MTFSIGITPAAASPAGDRLEDRPEAADRRAGHVAEGRQHGVLGERARLSGIGDGRCGHGGECSGSGGASDPLPDPTG